MTRRLLGYVVKLPNGTRSPLTPEPVKLYEAEVIWDKTPLDAGDWVAPVFAVRKPKPAEPEPAPRPNPPCFCCGVGVEPGPCDDGFTDGERVACGHCGATNYPTVADDGTVEMSDGAEDEGDETKPAPVVAAEGTFAVLVQHEGHEATTFLNLDMAVTAAPFREVGTRAEVLAAVENETPAFRRMAVRILPDGAHEAAIAAAREEGRREGWLEAVTMLREGLTAERDDARADMDKRDTESHEAGYVAGVTWAIAQINESVREAAKGAAK